MSSKNSPDEDFKTPKKRITASLDLVDFVVVDRLIGIEGSSRSNVIAHIIKDWIKANSEKVKKDWGIDLVEIRRKVIAEERGLPRKKELKELDEEILKRVVEFFEMADDSTFEELADYANIDRKSVRDLIIGHKKKLEENGLNLILTGGRLKKIV